jgi:hypothetical protein
MERDLFPNLWESNILYAKDYLHMKKMKYTSTERLNVGVKPKSEAEEIYSIDKIYTCRGKEKPK